MKFDIFSFLKRKKMPKSKAAVDAVFEAVGIKDSDEWRTIESQFADCEMPPNEIIYAAFRRFISAKDLYVNEQTFNAFTLREEIITTIMSMIEEDEA